MEKEVYSPVVLLHPFGGSLASKTMGVNGYIREIVHSVNFVGRKLLVVVEQLM